MVVTETFPIMFAMPSEGTLFQIAPQALARESRTALKQGIHQEIVPTDLQRTLGDLAAHWPLALTTLHMMHVLPSMESLIIMAFVMARAFQFFRKLPFSLWLTLAMQAPTSNVSIETSN
jgi:hypothetical protein